MCLGGFESLHLGHNELFKLAKSYKNDNPNSKLAISIFANSIKNNEVIEKKLLQLKVRLYILANLDFDYVFFLLLISVDYMPSCFFAHPYSSQVSCK